MDQFILFTIVMMRMTGFVVFNPIFGRVVVPKSVRAIIIMALSVSVFPLIDTVDVSNISQVVYALILFKEFAVGFIFGFVMRLYEFIVVHAGGIIDYEMGLSMAAIYDAQHGGQIPLSGNLLQIFYYLLFFATNGHLAITRIMFDSFQIIPIASVKISPLISDYMLDLFVTCVVMAVRFAMPLMILELLTEMAVGILMKVIPSINVFVINLQMKILIGLLMLLMLVSPINEYLLMIINNMSSSLEQLLYLFR